MKLSEKARAKRSHDIKAGLKKSKESGGRPSGNPALVGGLDDGGVRLEEHLAAIAVGKKEKANTFAASHRERIEKLVKEGVSYRGIAACFNEEGIQTRRKRLWTAVTVKRVLARPVNNPLAGS